MNTEQFFKSTYFKYALYGLAIIVLLLGAFRLGILVGFDKAKFSQRWGENYGRNFGAPRGMTGWGNFPGMMRGDFPDKDFINPHGTTGQVLKIEGDFLIIKGDDNVEKKIVASTTTTIIKSRDNIKLSDIKLDEYVTVIGQPNDSGQIEAKFIRVFDKQNLK